MTTPPQEPDQSSRLMAERMTKAWVEVLKLPVEELRRRGQKFIADHVSRQ
jgi:hypothetical protein